MIMSSAGYIYTQLMEEASSAQHGPFYVTNVLEVNHEDLKLFVQLSGAKILGVNRSIIICISLESV